MLFVMLGGGTIWVEEAMLNQRKVGMSKLIVHISILKDNNWVVHDILGFLGELFDLRQDTKVILELLEVGVHIV